MKRLLLILPLLACFLGAVPAHAALTDNIQAYYKLNDTSDSASTNTLTNNNSVTFDAGFIGNGADFGSTNTNKYFGVGNALGLTFNGSKTISVWVKIQTPPASGKSYNLALLFTTNRSGIHAIHYDNVGGTLKVIVERYAQGGTEFDNLVTVNQDLGTGVWHHIVLTYDNSSALLGGYIDNVSMGTISSSNSTSGTGVYTDSFYLGADNSGNNSLSGNLDEVGVWSRLLSSTEIGQLYNSGTGCQYAFSPLTTPQCLSTPVPGLQATFNGVQVLFNGVKAIFY